MPIPLSAHSSRHHQATRIDSARVGRKDDDDSPTPRFAFLFSKKSEVVSEPARATLTTSSFPGAALQSCADSCQRPRVPFTQRRRQRPIPAEPNPPAPLDEKSPTG